jgi:hypothetical protein
LGACTLAALWPLRSQSAVGTVVYLVGMTFNELPVLALLGAVAATLLAVAQGDLATPLGVASAALMAVVAAGLLLVVWRAVRSRDVPERALDDALGTRWRADIAPHLAAGLQTSPAIVRGLLLPLLRRRPDVRRVRDLNYGDGSRNNRLDLFLPRHRPADGPVLVHFHGGRFVSGAKNRESLYLLHRLAACAGRQRQLPPRALQLAS